MILTKDFEETVVDRAVKDSVFRIGLLSEAMDCLFEGDIDVARSLLRDYNKATGFLEKTKKPTQR